MKEGEEKEEGEEEEEDAEEVFQCTLASPSASSRPRGALCHGARAASEVLAGAPTRRSRRNPQRSRCNTCRRTR